MSKRGYLSPKDFAELLLPHKDFTVAMAAAILSAHDTVASGSGVAQRLRDLFDAGLISRVRRENKYIYSMSNENYLGIIALSDAQLMQKSMPRSPACSENKKTAAKNGQKKLWGSRIIGTPGTTEHLCSGRN